MGPTIVAVNAANLWGGYYKIFPAWVILEVCGMMCISPGAGRNWQELGVLYVSQRQYPDSISILKHPIL